jgi:hypothetical protein
MSERRADSDIVLHKVDHVSVSSSLSLLYMFLLMNNGDKTHGTTGTVDLNLRLFITYLFRSAALATLSTSSVMRRLPG